MKPKPRGLTNTSLTSPYFLNMVRSSSSFMSAVMLPMKRRQRPVNFFLVDVCTAGGPLPPWW